jgi:hypothetical protein
MALTRAAAEMGWGHPAFVESLTAVEETGAGDGGSVQTVYP